MLHLEDLTWPELDALDRARTVVFIPFSPLEEHGPHLPLGTDLFVARHFAEAIALELAERRPSITALIMPPVPLGAGTMPLRGSVNITVDVVYDVACQIGAALARDGFRYIVFTNGHLGAWHLLALENAARRISRRYRVHAIAPSAALARALMQRGTLTDAIGDRLTTQELAELLSAAHGGMLETSIMLRLRPDLVQAGYAQLPKLTRAALLRWRGRTPAGWPGYVGSPAGADAEWGGIATKALSGAGADLIVRLLDEGLPARKAAHALPRVPFWLAARRLGMFSLAAGLGAGVTLLATKLLERTTRHV